MRSKSQGEPRARRRIAGYALAVAALLVSVAPASALQVESAEDGRGPYRRHPEAAEAIAQLKSPYCPGFMLEVCSSAAGAALRDSIEDLADQGWDSDQIVDWVLANHGEQYLGLPRREGKALIAWVVPPVAILLGFGMVLVALRRMRSARPTLPRERELTGDDEQRLRDALRELEAEEDVPFL